MLLMGNRAGGHTISGSRRTCPQGHVYYKSSDCPVCPRCEALRNKLDFFVEGLSAPARRALDKAGILTPKALARFTENEILQLHGIGPSSLPVLAKALAEKGLAFRSGK